MRAVVTGASGQLGAALVHQLVAEGVTVMAVVRPGGSLDRLEASRGHVQIVRAELPALAGVGKVLQEFRPDTMYHLAWFGVARAQRDAPEQVTHNVTGALELFRLAADAGCTSWIGVGSQAEYGVPTSVLSEATPTHPVTAYGVAKLCTGMLVQTLADLRGVRFAWLRLLATYGPADTATHLIPSTIARLLAGETPPLTSGEQRWDYLYVTDAARALTAVGSSPTAAGNFVLGSGHAARVRDIVEQLRDLIDPSLELGFGAIPYGDRPIMHLQADVSRLQQLTGWRPVVSLDEGLHRTVEWYRAQSARQDYGTVAGGPHR